MKRTPVEPYDPLDIPTSIDREVPEEVPRDQWGRPLIAPVGIDPATCMKPPPRKSIKRKPGQNYFIPYTRVSTLAKALDDQVKIEGWRARNTALGVALSPSLAVAFRAIGDVNLDENKDEANRHVESAMERSGANERSRLGSGLHKFTEKWDKGVPVGEPGEYRDDIRAYVMATHGYTMQHVERFMVNDAHEDAGTPDRIVYNPKLWTGPRIGDVKTGNDVLLYAQLSIAMQLANYADSDFYDPATGERTGWEIDPFVGVVWHLPAGEGRCIWYEVDLSIGREGIELAHKVRNTRKIKGIFTKIEEEPSDLIIHELIDTATSRQRMLDVRKLFGNEWQEEHDNHAIDALAKLNA